MRYDASIRHDLVSRPARTPEERRALGAFKRQGQIYFEYGTENHRLFRFKTPNTLHFSNGVTRRLTPIDDDIYHPHSEQWRGQELYGIFGDPKGLHMRVKGHFTQYPYDHPYAQGPVFVVRNMFPRNKKLMPLLHEEVKRLGGNAVVVGGDTFGLGVPWTKPQIRDATSTPETVAEQIQRMGAVTRRNALESQEKLNLSLSPFLLRNKNMFDEYFSIRKAIPTWEQMKEWRKKPLSRYEERQSKKLRTALQESRSLHALQTQSQEWRDALQHSRNVAPHLSEEEHQNYAYQMMNSANQGGVIQAWPREWGPSPVGGGFDAARRYERSVLAAPRSQPVPDAPTPAATQETPAQYTRRILGETTQRSFAKEYFSIRKASNKPGAV